MGLATPLSELRTMRDLTVGVVGFGRIGREVLMRLAPFKCQRLVYDPVVDPQSIQAMGCQPATLDELLAKSDVVSLHCPSNDATRRMIRRETIEAMKPTSLLINLARGDLVDTDALVEALQSKKISGAALDVFAPEPLPESHPLRSMPNVVTASHIASASLKRCVPFANQLPSLPPWPSAAKSSPALSTVLPSPSSTFSLHR